MCFAMCFAICHGECRVQHVQSLSIMVRNLYDSIVGPFLVSNMLQFKAWPTQQISSIFFSRVRCHLLSFKAQLRNDLQHLRSENKGNWLGDFRSLKIQMIQTEKCIVYLFKVERDEVLVPQLAFCERIASVQHGNSWMLVRNSDGAIAHMNQFALPRRPLVSSLERMKKRNCRVHPKMMRTRRRGNIWFHHFCITSVDPVFTKVQRRSFNAGSGMATVETLGVQKLEVGTRAMSELLRNDMLLRGS